jgi:hypothetical protein
MLNWYTFFALSLLCCGVGYNFLPDRIADMKLPFLRSHILISELDLGRLGYIAVLFTSIYTFIVVVQLVRGSQSHDGNAMAWEIVLGMALDSDAPKCSAPPPANTQP